MPAWGLLALLSGLSGLLRFYRLGTKPFWIGEIQELAAARSERWWAQVLDSGTDVLGFVWNHFLYALDSPPDEFRTRFLAALAGTLTVAVVYRLGAVLHSRVAGLAAALLLAINFYHVYFSQDARSVAYLTFFYALSWLAMVETMAGKSRWWGVAFSLSAGLAGLSHSVAGLYLIIQGAFFIGMAILAGQRAKARGENGDRLRAGLLVRYAVPAMGALVIASLQLYVIADYAFAFSNTRPPVANSMSSEDFFLLPLWLAHLAGTPVVVGSVQLLLALVGFETYRRLRPGSAPMREGKAASLPRGWQAVLVGLWLLAPPVLLYVVSARATARLEPYHVLPCVVPFVLAVGGGLSATGGLLVRLILSRLRSVALWPSRYGPVAVALLFATAIQLWGNYSQLERYYDRPTRLWQGADLKGVAEFLGARELTREDTIFLDYSEHMVPVNFYAGKWLKQTNVVVPRRPEGLSWQHHLLLRARFQATDSDIVRLRTDEIVAVSELRPDERVRTGRAYCLLFWPEASRDQKGYANYYEWLTGDELYVAHGLEGPVPAGWDLHRFAGVDLLVRESGDYTVGEVFPEVELLLGEFAQAMSKGL